MKILHYSLGISPYRTGGLTKYSQDIMEEQAKNGEKVYLLFPGSNSKNGILHIKKYKIKKNIEIFEVVNPLPVPLLGGIINPKLFKQSGSVEVYEDFLRNLEIEIVHVHTFMGMHIEFLKACRNLKIKVVFTTHDYFGLCPKVNFIDCSNNVCTVRDAGKCSQCNKDAVSLKKIKILQSRLYREFKNLGGVELIKKIKIKRVNNYPKEKDISKHRQSEESIVVKEDMQELLQYYIDMFNLIDFFLFNSSLSKKIYNNYIDTSGEVLYITHNKISDNRKIKSYDDELLKITYLGPNKSYKGFNILINIMKSLEEKGYNKIKINMYGDSNIPINHVPNNVKINGRYKYEDLNEIFNNTDIVIVPSMWYETFGFITLEALSFGVPVIVTDKVGSKDILINNGISKGYVVEDKKEEMENLIIDIFNDKKVLKELNSEIVNDKFNYDIKTHCDKIKKYYEALIT